jgi:dATP pyrophosphohydrolase
MASSTHFGESGRRTVTEIAYAVILIVRRTPGGDEFLMARRAAGKYMGGTWQLISGGIDPDEMAWQAAIRELREETELLPTELYRLSTLTRFYRPDVDAICTGVMFCAIVAPDATVQINFENDEHAWIARANVADRLMWPSDKEAFAEVCREILDDGPAKPYLRIELPAGERDS